MLSCKRPGCEQVTDDPGKWWLINTVTLTQESDRRFALARFFKEIYMRNPGSEPVCSYDCAAKMLATFMAAQHHKELEP